jgi:hypothetical protein
VTVQPSDRARALTTAAATAAALGLRVDDTVVLQDSNRVTARLLPCDVLVRVALPAHQAARFELELSRALVAAGSPVAAPDPRVPPRPYERDGVVTTFWTYYPPVGATGPAGYAAALHRLHAGLRALDVPAPHVTDRITQAERLVADRARTPELSDVDRTLLAAALDRGRRLLRGRPEQLLHGEPHPGNLLSTSDGPLFVDLETCCRGPVEFDLAHAPEEVDGHYPGADADLVRDCRLLVLAMITTWRWDVEDDLPDGRRLGREWLAGLRAAGEAQPGSGRRTAAPEAN